MGLLDLIKDEKQRAQDDMRDFMATLSAEDIERSVAEMACYFRGADTMLRALEALRQSGVDLETMLKMHRTSLEESRKAFEYISGHEIKEIKPTRELEVMAKLMSLNKKNK